MVQYHAAHLRLHTKLHPNTRCAVYNIEAGKKQAKKTESKPKKERSEAASTGNLQPRPAPPNKILFVENLPEQVNEMMLSMLFQQYVYPLSCQIIDAFLFF